MGDIQAAIDALPKPCFVTGFCWGGAAAWAAAQRCTHVRAASCFYGRLITNLLDAPPRAPVILHYGARDASIPSEDVERVRAANPNAPIYLYDAGHGFCRKASADYDAALQDHPKAAFTLDARGVAETRKGLTEAGAADIAAATALAPKVADQAKRFGLTL